MSSEGPGETARMRRLAWASAARQRDNYQTHMYMFVNVDLSDPVETDANLVFKIIF